MYNDGSYIINPRQKLLIFEIMVYYIFTDYNDNFHTI